MGCARCSSDDAAVPDPLRVNPVASGAGHAVRFAPPRGVLEIADRLERAGYETWCVGGAVRDALLGHAQLDWDLATSARPHDVQRLFRRTVPKGIEFGTVGVFDSDGAMHEVTTFRHDVTTDGRHAVVAFGASLDDDLARRDFTMNAIAYSPRRGTLYDPFDGTGDLRRGVVRAVGDPGLRMQEDRLRALRAIRFAGRFDFAIEPGTWDAIVASAPFLGRLSTERVREEIEKTMRQVARPSGSFERWRASGAFTTLVPSLADVSPLRFHTLDCLPPPSQHRPLRLTLRLVALWLDSEPREAERALRTLKASNAQVRAALELTTRWRELAPPIRAALVAADAAGEPAGGTAPSDATIRRWAAAAGRTRLAMVLRLLAARWAAERATGADPTAVPSVRAARSLYRRAIRIAYRDPIELADLAVDGDDLARVPTVRGRMVGAVLRALLDDVVDDPTRNVSATLLDRALAHADRIAAESGASTGSMIHHARPA